MVGGWWAGRHADMPCRAVCVAVRQLLVLLCVWSCAAGTEVAAWHATSVPAPQSRRCLCGTGRSDRPATGAACAGACLGALRCVCVAHCTVTVAVTAAPTGTDRAGQRRERVGGLLLGRPSEKRRRTRGRGAHVCGGITAQGCKWRLAMGPLAITPPPGDAPAPTAAAPHRHTGS